MAFKLNFGLSRTTSKERSQRGVSRIMSGKSPLHRDPSGKELEEIREKPGQSNAYKYKDVPESEFAGPNETYPINTLERAKSALKLAHNAANPDAIKAKVYAMYPELKPEGVSRKSSESPLNYSGHTYGEPGDVQQADFGDAMSQAWGAGSEFGKLVSSGDDEESDSRKDDLDKLQKDNPDMTRGEARKKRRADKKV